jgi:zinc/manganese transport system permease protein
VLHDLIEPGFFASSPVHVAAIVGAVVASVCGVVGVFTVVRSQAFAGHAMGEIASAGGSGAFLVGVSPLLGFVGAGVAAAGAMEMIGIRRARGRDLATGIVLGAGLGTAALFLYFDTTAQSTTGAAVTVLFGSMFAIAASTVPAVAALSVATLVLVAGLYRPLLLSSVSPELAAVRGVPVRLVGALYLAALAIAVALSALTVGSILSTALLIGPAAAATRLTRRPGPAMLVAAGGGVALTWLGILLAYDSYYWPPRGTGWPVSFFIVTLVLVAYLAAAAVSSRRRRAGTEA